MYLLADRTNPKRIARRRWQSTKGRIAGLRYSIMGAAGDAKDSVSGTASDMADGVRHVPRTLARETQGSPIGAGIIAFGAGLLAAALIPETETERRAVAQVADAAGPMIEPVKEKAKEIGADVTERVKQSATEATREVGQTAKEAGSHTVEQARQSGSALQS